jgi:hypothetical protein
VGMNKKTRSHFVKSADALGFGIVLGLDDDRFSKRSGVLPPKRPPGPILVSSGGDTRKPISRPVGTP